MSKKNKPVFIVTSTDTNHNGEYITNGHNTSGIKLHFLMPELLWNPQKNVYVNDMQKIYKLKFSK